MNYKWLINLLPIKSGGGQQVATNFVHHLESFDDVKAMYVVTAETKMHHLLLNLCPERLVVVNNSLVCRLIFQLFGVQTIVDKEGIQLIYTLFGPSIIAKGIKSVTGCAYSNIFFPEIEFWQKESFFNRIIFRIIDWYRLRSTLRSDAIIFENSAMLERCVSLYGYPASKTKLILPSISEYGSRARSQEMRARLGQLSSYKFHISMLTGWHSNKNIIIVPDILTALKKQGVEDVCFVITVSPGHPSSIRLMECARSMGVEQNIILFSSVVPNEVPELIKSSDAMALFSLLESFSNNIIEAWYFEKPLFISDEEWSRSICNEAAVYVNRNNADDIADKIIKYRKNDQLFNWIKEAAEIELSKYPSPVEKVALQVEFLKNVMNEQGA